MYVVGALLGVSLGLLAAWISVRKGWAYALPVAAVACLVALVLWLGFEAWIAFAFLIGYLMGNSPYLFEWKRQTQNA